MYNNAIGCVRENIPLSKYDLASATKMNKTSLYTAVIWHSEFLYVQLYKLWKFQYNLLIFEIPKINPLNYWHTMNLLKRLQAGQRILHGITEAPVYGVFQAQRLYKHKMLGISIALF